MAQKQPSKIDENKALTHSKWIRLWVNLVGFIMEILANPLSWTLFWFNFCNSTQEIDQLLCWVKILCLRLISIPVVRDWQKGHGIPDSLLKGVRDITRRFFELPYEEKAKIKMTPATGFRFYWLHWSMRLNSIYKYHFNTYVFHRFIVILIPD